MTVSYLPKAGRKLEVSINGAVTQIDALPDNGTVSTVTIPVSLKAGYNRIEMGSSYCWAVDVDKFELIER